MLFAVILFVMLGVKMEMSVAYWTILGIYIGVQIIVTLIKACMDN